MRTLIVGATGAIGSCLKAACIDRNWPTTGTAYRRHGANLLPLDVRDEDAVRELIADLQPELTLYAAPFDGFANVLRAVSETSGLLVIATSGTVFGKAKLAQKESARANPTDALAASHATAERLLARDLPGRHLIVRTDRVFGGSRCKVVESLCDRLRREASIRLCNHDLGQPTYGPDLAESMLDLLKHDQRGIVHAVGPDRHSPFSFARLVAFLHGYPADRLEALVETGGGRSCYLDRQRLRELLGPKAIRPVADGLRAMRHRSSATRRIIRAA